MNKYKFSVAVIVEVEAFDEDDAWDALQDSFGIGENSPGIVVTDCEWKPTKK